MADPLDTSIPLAERVGTQLFQLKPSVGAFADQNSTTVSPVGHVLFDAASRVLSVNEQTIPDEHLSWNDVANSVCWVYADANICTGRLSFTDDLHEAIGTITTRDGESIVVTGSAMLPRDGDAPPSYVDALTSTPSVAPSTANASIANSIPPFTVLAAGSVMDSTTNLEKEATSNIYVTEYKTVRRLQGDKDGEWTPWYSLEWGIEKDVVGTPIICYVNDQDVSSSTTLDHGVTDATVLVKTDGDPKNSDLDYRFRISLNRPGVETEQTFTGTLEMNNKIYDWKGAFRKVVTQLMAITSLKSTTKEVKVDVPKPDGSTGTDTRVVTEDMAQEEGDRIFARIILHSAPEDVRKLIDPDLKALDAEEQGIAALGPSYLQPAAIVNVMSFLKSSEAVPMEQRQRINEDKLKAFTRACAMTGEPKSGAKDWVTEWGWKRDTKDDKMKIQEIQFQYRAVTQACYRLGYRRTVLELQPFLQDAGYWYHEFADYLCGNLHIQELTLRSKAGDSKITHDVYDWQTKLQILEEAANIPKKEQKIETVISHLHGATIFSTMDGIAWSSEHASNILKFFEDMDEVEKATKMGAQSELAMAGKTKEFMAVRSYLEEREHLTYSELGKQLIHALDAHARSLERPVFQAPAQFVEEFGQELVDRQRAPSLGEVAVAVGEEAVAGQPPTTWQLAKPYFRWAARAAVVAAGVYFLQKSLREGIGKLDLHEQISMFAALFEATRHASQLLGAPVTWIAQRAAGLARGVGNAVAGILPQRAVALLQAARNWIVGVVEGLGQRLGALAVRFGEAVPGPLAHAAAVARGFLGRNWRNIAKGIGIAFGAAISIWAAYAGYKEFERALKDGRTVDIVLSGAQFFFTAMSTLAFGLQIIGSIAESARLVAFAGTLGLWAAGLGIAFAVIAVLVTLNQPQYNPIKDIIDKYGAQYDLLKKT